MANTSEKGSEYVYDLSSTQMAALLKIAKAHDRPFLELVMEALDQYIERESRSCQPTI